MVPKKPPRKKSNGAYNTLRPLVSLVAAIALVGLTGCQSSAALREPVIIEQSYSPAPTWLDGHLPQRRADGSLELTYKSPAAANLDLDLAANQLASTIAMFTKEQLAGYIESAFIAAEPSPLGAVTRASLNQTIADEVARGIDSGQYRLEDYYYRKTKLGNRQPKTELFALITIPRPAYRGIVTAIAATLRQSSSQSLRALARFTSGRF